MQNIDESDGLVTTNDRYGYWGGIDDKFNGANRLHCKKENTFYIDGSYRIWTSNHVNMASFAGSMLTIEAEYTDYSGDNYSAVSSLNTEANLDGFNYRKYQGRLAGQAFLAKIKSDPKSVGVKDTVDIVAHSMGYAYAVGFIEEIKNEVKFGRFYIFAPENACSGGNDWSLFEEVWQYGANNNVIDENVSGALNIDGTRDPYWWQDGIAPQCAVQNIDQLPANKGGRIYIPKTFSEKGFNASHFIKNYTWVFDIPQNSIGYVKKR